MSRPHRPGPAPTSGARTSRLVESLLARITSKGLRQPDLEAIGSGTRVERRGGGYLFLKALDQLEQAVGSVVAVVASLGDLAHDSRGLQILEGHQRPLMGDGNCSSDRRGRYDRLGREEIDDPSGGGVTPDARLANPSFLEANDLVGQLDRQGRRPVTCTCEGRAPGRHPPAR